MGFYSRTIFPCICEFVLNTPIIANLRHELLAGVHGDILEIGFGTGLNLPHYPPDVRRITTVDPNPGMNRLAEKRIQQTGIEVDQQVQSSEQLPFEDGSFDCVVSTFTLCSIGQVDRAMSEVFRVLKTGGHFLFLEHGLSPEPSVQKWQRRLNRLEMLLADGCHLDRNIKNIVGSQFSKTKVEESYLEKTPKILGYSYRGVATK